MARRPLVLVAAAACLALVAGCSSISTGGGVVEVGRVAENPAEGVDADRDFQVRRVPAGPPPGEVPAGIVERFVDAQASYDNDHAVARSFLVPESEWDAGGDATVFDQRRLGAARLVGDRAEVPVQVRRRGIVNTTTGEYRPVRATQVQVVFKLAKVNGEWRVTDPPAGMLVEEDRLERAFRRVVLYFPDFARQRLVPQQLFLPQAVETPFVATVLRALLAGPRPSLAAAVRTAVPQGTELIDLPTVADRQVTVNLSREVRRASSETQPLLAAQIVWTLTEPSLGFTAVRLLVEGEPLTGRGRRTRADFLSYSPEPAPGDERTFFVQSGRLHALDDSGDVQVVRADGGLRLVSVSRSGVQLAVVRPVGGGRRTLLVGRLSGGALRSSVTARRLTEPSWEADGDAVWTVAQDDGPPRVYVVPVEGGRAEVRTPNLSGIGRISALQLAPGGARAVILAGGTLWQAYVQPQPDGTHVALGGLRRVFDDITGVSAVTWETATRLVFVGSVAGRRGLYQVDYDGFGLAPVPVPGLPRLPDALAGGRGATGLPVLAEVAGRLWRRERSGDWREVATGFDPTYAG